MLNDFFQSKITDATAIVGVRPKILLPFNPKKLRITNTTSIAVIDFSKDFTSVTANAGGIMTTGTTSPARTKLTATTGITVSAGGKHVRYNDPQVPSYKDQDDAAVTAGSIFDEDGNDWLTRELPQQVNADSDDIYANPHYLGNYILELPLESENGDIRGDGEEIIIEAWK